MATGYSKLFLPVNFTVYRSGGAIDWSTSYPKANAIDGDVNTYALPAATWLPNENEETDEIDDLKEIAFEDTDENPSNANSRISYMYVMYNFDELPNSAQITGAQTWCSFYSASTYNSWNAITAWEVRNYTEVGSYTKIYENTLIGTGTTNVDRVFYASSWTKAATKTGTCTNSSDSNSFLKTLLYSDGKITPAQWHIKHSETSRYTGPTLVLQHTASNSSGYFTASSIRWNEFCQLTLTYDLPDWTIYFNSSTSGSCTLSATGGTGTITSSSIITDEATAITLTCSNIQSGYKFRRWIDEDGTVVSTDASFTVYPDAAHTYTAVVEQLPVITWTYTASQATVTAKLNGTTVTSPVTTEFGDTIVFTAKPKTSDYYYMSAWNVDGTRISTGYATTTQTYTISDIQANHTVVIECKKYPYITVETMYSDTGTVSGSGYYLPGTTQTISVTTIEENFEELPYTYGTFFRRWSDETFSGTNQIGTINRTITIGETDTTYTAIVRNAPLHTISVNDSDAGDANYAPPQTPSNTNSIRYLPTNLTGKQGWISWQAYDYYFFDHINSETPTPSSSNLGNIYFDVVVDDSDNLEPTARTDTVYFYSNPSYLVGVNPVGAGCTITEATHGTAETLSLNDLRPGQSYSFTANPADILHFSYWFDGYSTVGTDPTYVLQVDANQTGQTNLLVANFEYNAVITFNASEFVPTGHTATGETCNKVYIICDAHHSEIGGIQSTPFTTQLIRPGDALQVFTAYNLTGGVSTLYHKQIDYGISGSTLTTTYDSSVTFASFPEVTAGSSYVFNLYYTGVIINLGVQNCTGTPVTPGIMTATVDKDYVSLADTATFTATINSTNWHSLPYVKSNVLPTLASLLSTQADNLDFVVWRNPTSSCETVIAWAHYEQTSSNYSSYWSSWHYFWPRNGQTINTAVYTRDVSTGDEEVDTAYQEYFNTVSTWVTNGLFYYSSVDIMNRLDSTETLFDKETAYNSYPLVADHFRFDKWYEEIAGIIILENPATISIPGYTGQTQDNTYTLTINGYYRQQYQLDISFYPDEDYGDSEFIGNGLIDVESDALAHPTVIAYPDTTNGYTFRSWNSDSLTELSTSNPYTFTMSSDTKIYVRFYHTFYIHVKALSDSVSGGEYPASRIIGDGEHVYGTTVTIGVNPYAYDLVDEWQDSQIYTATREITVTGEETYIVDMYPKAKLVYDGQQSLFDKGYKVVKVYNGQQEIELKIH